MVYSLNLQNSSIPYAYAKIEYVTVNVFLKNKMNIYVWYAYSIFENLYPLPVKRYVSKLQTACDNMEYVISGMNLRVNSSCSASLLQVWCTVCVLLLPVWTYATYATTEYVRIRTYSSENRIGLRRIGYVCSSFGIHPEKS